MEMKKALVVLAVLVIVIGSVEAYIKLGNRADGAAGRMGKAAMGQLIVTVSASGAIEPGFSVEVKSKASGEILSFDSEPGDVVSQGQTIITLDQRTEQRNLAQREADLSRAMAELDSAKANLMEKSLNLKRTAQLFNKKLVSDQARDGAVAAEAMARARIGEVQAAVSKARLVVDDARERLEDTVITSPIDGSLVEKSVQRGQIISSGISSVSGGTKLCVVADLSRLVIYAMVDETDIGKVSAGQIANVTVDAWPGRIFKGAVRRVHPMGESSDNITVFKVEVEVSGGDAAILKPKMTANVDIVISTHENVLLIHDEAIYRDMDSGNNFVYLKDGRGSGKRVVKTGSTNGFDTVILSGLKAGDAIFLKPQKKHDKGR